MRSMSTVTTLFAAASVALLTGCGGSDEPQSNVVYADDAQLANESGCYIENVTETSFDFICPDKDGSGEKEMTVEGNFVPDADNSEFTNDGKLSRAVVSVTVVDNSDKETDELAYEVRVFHNVNGAGCATIIDEEGKISFDKCQDTDDVNLVANAS